MRYSRIAGLAPLLLLGCAAPGLSIRGEATPESRTRDAALLTDVSRVRELPLRRDVVMQYRGAKRDRAGPSSDEAGISNQALARRLPVWIAFGMVSPHYDLEDAGRVAGHVRAAVSATYDDRERIIEVRIDAADQQRDGTVAHEMVHALTDQHFQLRRLRAVGSDDAALAARAVAEGDADFTRRLWEGLRAGRKQDAVLARIGRASTALAGRELSGETLEKLPFVVREMVAFPYLSGLHFIALIHAAGGFPLVNRIYHHLPQSTEQVLHPQKYADGEPPLRVPSPPVPAGWRPVYSATLGELGIRSLFERCLPAARARSAAEGWGGDRFLVIDKQGVLPRLLWSTAWDDEEAATEFAQAMKDYSRPSCHHASGVDWRTAPMAPFTVERQGSRVVVARGLDGEATRAVIAEMLAARIDPGVNQPPLGPLALHQPPRPPAPVLKLTEGFYRSEVLGISGEVPDGEYGSTDVLTGTFELASRERVRLWLKPMRSPPDPAMVERVIATIGGKMRAGTFERAVVETGLGTATSLRWTMPRGDGAPGHLRILLLPLCDGKRTLVQTEGWSGDAGAEMLRAWTASLRKLKSPGSYCSQEAGDDDG